MRALLQRVSSARVRVGNEVTGEIGPGLLVLLGVSRTDQEADLQLLVDKIINLRIFEDDQGKMNLSVQDVGGAILVVSQFTLYADCRKGRRPSFLDAAPPAMGEDFYERFIAALRAKGMTVATGRFGASMAVELVNDGPVTIMLDTADWQKQG
ncbi:MAG TPA: D-tyrosyl-tRNA(Tyr) deacylase [Firmicutes bacterium]|uniref:D-aminoacyl-tRNA deacylase n=1 Tax=Capillibacterium thermochitinicola TaxID=2699427 RepID=A0A8J6I0I9_9FIRM|nr:D-aminoacyl-tRNA deacylase [Capillibacterium thermochitinicola]MBA2133033.1 D-tyrosyl-tRNA(Tyr) deacylase [Capillibacterium thermochitinicola]HHW12994.1 D-tyrosyl-tRNA(Tyr) deacylase [Bacillota bacterium]